MSEEEVQREEVLGFLKEKPGFAEQYNQHANGSTKQTQDLGAVDLDEPKCSCANLPSPESWFPAGCEEVVQLQNFYKGGTGVGSTIWLEKWETVKNH